MHATSVMTFGVQLQILQANPLPLSIYVRAHYTYSRTHTHTYWWQALTGGALVYSICWRKVSLCKCKQWHDFTNHQLTQYQLSNKQEYDGLRQKGNKNAYDGLRQCAGDLRTLLQSLPHSVHQKNVKVISKRFWDT